MPDVLMTSSTSLATTSFRERGRMVLRLVGQRVDYQGAAFDDKIDSVRVVPNCGDGQTTA